MPTWLVQKFAPICAPFFAHVFNVSLERGYHPASQKKAIVHSGFKPLATSRSFSFNASDVRNNLPVHVSSASTLPVFRRWSPFIPSYIPLIHYTDHRSRNLSQYHVVHLTRFSPAPAIIWFLHSRLGLAIYVNWRVCKGCVTYSIIINNIVGKRKIVLNLQKCFETLLQQCRIQHFSRGQYLGPPFLGVMKVFFSPKIKTVLLYI